MTRPADRFPTGSPSGSFWVPSPHRFPVPYPYGDRNRCDRFPHRSGNRSPMPRGAGRDRA